MKVEGKDKGSMKSDELKTIKMKKHNGHLKGRSVLILATLGICSMLGACKAINRQQATETGEGEILLVERDENYSWGYVSDGGYFVDTNGRLYPYSNGIEHLYDDYRGKDFSYLDYLETIRENYKVEAYIDRKYVDKIKKLGKDLSPDDEFEEVEMRCDYGKETVYYFDSDLRQFLKCKSTGDVDEIPKNKSAEKIADLVWDDLDDRVSKTGIFSTVPRVYLPKWCFMTEIKVSDPREWSGKWILKDKDMLQAFAEQSGIDVNEILKTMEETKINNTAFEMYDFKADKVFLVNVINANDIKEMRKPKAVWVCGDCCDYLYYEEQEEVKSSICLVSAVERIDLPEELTTMSDLDGNAWKIFEGK